MKQYQLYVRMHDCDQWSYGDTYTEPSIVWHGMLLARHRGMQCRIVTTKPGAARECLEVQAR